MDWKTVVSKLAPTVASALGSPLAGAAVFALGELLGISEPTQDKIKAVIEGGQMTGEQLAGIKALELKYKAEEEERGFRYADLEVKDVQGARDRDVDLAKTGQRNYRADSMFLLAVAVICGLVWIVWKDAGINEYVKGIFTLVLGRFLGYLDNIYSFEFGSTRAGHRQTELLAQSAPPSNP